jgi:transcriptional regulator with PAS, ATPase and Fis domain
VAATNQDLSKPVQEGRFRNDLYYRGKVLKIELSLLSQRRDDNPLGINAFMKNGKFQNRLVQALIESGKKFLPLLTAQKGERGNIQR